MADMKEYAGKSLLQPSPFEVVEDFATDGAIPEHIGQQPLFMNGCNCGFCVAQRKCRLSETAWFYRRIG